MTERDSSYMQPKPESPSEERVDDEQTDWEEVEVEEQILDFNEIKTADGPLIEHSKAFEVTLDKNFEQKKADLVKKTIISHAERVKRLQVHKAHTVCLISNGWIRNQYLNDHLLHARLISLTPLPLQMAFSQIHKKFEHDVKRRGRLFETAMMRLTQWWQEIFFHASERGRGEVQSRTFDEVAAELRRKELDHYRSSDDDDDKKDEIIRSPKSLQKHALSHRGSRDVSSQLFTALCRGLGIPARLVVSIQSTPWKASIGRFGLTDPNKDHSDEGDTQFGVPQPAASSKSKGKAKASFPGVGQVLSGSPSAEKSSSDNMNAKPVILLRRQHPQGRRLGAMKKESEPSQDGYPPTMWTEVFSRPDGRWLPVDPIRNIVNNRKVFEPSPHDKRNRMIYVLAFEEDGYARDVTQRYVRAFTSKTVKARGSKGQKAWWDKVTGALSRPYRLHRDDVEDAELLSRQMVEGMPTSIAGFKDHPLYVLERHLLQNEVVNPRIEIGRFRGEPVFSRENVISGLKTAENWMRSGRVVKAGQQPLKSVKVRASTISRRRAIGIAGETMKGESEVMQGLYTYDQTELYHPPPVINGKVPKNDFGNIDLYVDSMLPDGAAYIPYKGAGKITKELGFDYAEAVTGFEFKSRRAFPIISGIVVAEEHETAVIEAYLESVHDAEEKGRRKMRERILARWTRLVQGLRIRKRLQDQYSNDVSATSETRHDTDNYKDLGTDLEPGGFLLETADDVVQAYTLPKPLHVIDRTSSEDIREQEDEEDVLDLDRGALHQLESDDKQDVDPHEWAYEAPQIIMSQAHPIARAPKTLQELADSSPDLFPFSEQFSTGSSAPLDTTQTDCRSTRHRAERTLIRTRSRRRRKRGKSTSSENDTDGDPPNTLNNRSGKSKVKTDITSTPSGRTLRTRMPKSEEKIRQEHELELAFRRAIRE